ncbi:MAG: alpha-amylase family glycosyl hydrolase, partial [Nocardioidaceae bacterium]
MRDTDHAWWQAGVVYQIYPRSFADAGGDGVGDLPGITSHLDYLERLGVDALWLSPIYPSPMVDFGYDVTDHTGIDPLFGDVEDFDALVTGAHERGLRVLVDFIPNHVSDQHPWFAEACSSREDPRRSWFLWADPAADGGPPNNWRSVFGGPAWTLHRPTGQYYYHAYLPEQPDLNWRNPDVRQAQLDVMRTWLDRGVDGFRVDAFRHLLKDDQLRDNPQNPAWAPHLPPYDALIPERTADLDDIHALVTDMREVLDTHPVPAGGNPAGERVMVGELYLPIDRLVRYYGEGGAGMHLPSNMHLIATEWDAVQIAELVDAYEAALPRGAWPNWVLGNHDRSRIATRVGHEQARVAAMLLLTLRGTPTMYYGDELAMCDVPVPTERAQDPYEHRVPGIGVGRDPERTPMQWAPGPNAGFCPEHVTPWLPVADNADEANVAVQSGDPTSMLALYQQLLALRREEPALAVGSYARVCARGDVYAYLRSHDGRRLLVALNLGGEEQDVDVAGALSEGRV